MALLGGDDSIEEIREYFAFSSNQYFNAIFKSVFGLIPNTYRKKFKKETIIHKVFSEDMIQNTMDFLNSEEKVNPENNVVELVLGDAPNKIIVLDTADGEERIRKYDITQNRKICIELNSDESVIMVKKQ